MLPADRESSRGGERWPGQQGSHPRPAALWLAVGQGWAQPSRVLAASCFSLGTRPKSWEWGARGQPRSQQCLHDVGPGGVSWGTEGEGLGEDVCCHLFAL